MCPPSCFLPAPKVTSAVVRMTVQHPPCGHWGRGVLLPGGPRRLCPAAQDPAQQSQFRLGRPAQQGELVSAMDACGLPADIRGERLGIPEFAALARRPAAEARPTQSRP